MKVVMLDIDGVLCTPESMKMGYVRVQDRPLHKFQRSCVAALNRLTDESGAVLVISSTWRHFGQSILEEHFKKEGITGKIVGITPNGIERRTASRAIIISVERGLEIQDWLDKNQGVESFVIIDDSSDMAHLMHKLVQTKWQDPDGDKSKEGLTEAKVDEALEMLRGK